MSEESVNTFSGHASPEPSDQTRSAADRTVREDPVSFPVDLLAQSLLNLLLEKPDCGSPIRLRPPDSESSTAESDQWRPESTNSDSSRYRIQSEIARGGMGCVLKGTDVVLGRDVAVKVLLSSHRHRPELVHRFLEEAQIAGQLQHPGIAPVYDLGRLADERPYFTMKLVKGVTLSALLADRSHPGDDLPGMLRVFEQVCQTMAYAHARGVVHRDLKPSNIMVGKFGEVQVMDWGLATILNSDGRPDTSRAHGVSISVICTSRAEQDSDHPATLAGSVLGTPAWMSPEQAAGQLDCVDTRSDVFALGAILCEILTGDPPYTEDDPDRVLRQARKADLASAFDRLNACGFDQDVVALAKRCLAPIRNDRPQNAGLLVAELQSWADAVGKRNRQDELDQARRSALSDLEKQLQSELRKRHLLTALLTVTVVLLVLLWLKP